MWGALIGAGIDLYNGQMNRLSGFFSQKKQYKYNKELQEDQQAFQREMWDLSNQYNLPINEVQRLLDAGINPALAFSNGGASAAPVPNSGSAGGVSAANFPSSPSIGGQLASNLIAKERVDSEIALNSATAERQKAEAVKAKAEADESTSRKNLNEIEYQVRSDPNYIQAQIDNPSLRNDLARLERDSRELGYSFDVQTYGLRLQSADLALDQQRLAFITSKQQLSNLKLDYARIGAHIRHLDAGTAQQRAQAAVLRQDLDIRAGKALLGTFQRQALEYCVQNNIKDSVTGEIKSFISVLADEYAAKVYEGVYTAKSSAVVASQDIQYQSEHGQERRGFETELIRRQGNYYRTSQWNMSINTGLSFVRTAIDAGSTIMTRGASKAVGGLITPNSNHSNMPLTPEAQKVLREVFPETERFLTY